jgi:enoyl-CoA hydratase/carnithine racemase
MTTSSPLATVLYHDISTSPALFEHGTVQVCRRGKDQSILLVALYRPHVKNAMNDHVYLDLIALLHASANDPSVAALVVTGTGTFFSSGADLKESFADLTSTSTTTHTTTPPSIPGRHTLHKPAGQFMMALLDYPKVLAAAVNGPAVGIACTLLLHCDLVHATSTATLWAPFARLALVPELCSSTTLVETLGLSRANEMLLLSQVLTADTAERWGILGSIDRDATSDDPMSPDSCASRLCTRIDAQLLQLPNGALTAEYFVRLVRQGRKERLQQVCLRELQLLDERFDQGHVAHAARHLQVGSRSKL